MVRRIKQRTMSRRRPIPCLNLVQNPSFEQGFAGWERFGDIAVISHPAFEGNHLVQMSPDPASIWQDVPLAGANGYPLLLSFNLRGSEVTDLIPPPRLIVDVIWMDSSGQIIGYGSRLLLNPGSVTGDDNERVPYFTITDRSPVQAAFARVLFSKQEGNEASFVQLDQVVLAPVLTSNLLKNPGFEIGMNYWSPQDFETGFQFRLEGAGAAEADEAVSTLHQDVPIANYPRGSSYLLGFGLQSEQPVTTLVQVLWLNRSGAVIGTPGLSLTIPDNTLPNQGGYLTYLSLTTPAPRGAVTARIVFSAEEPLRIDEVFFVRAATGNLVRNPGFESELEFWTFENVLVPLVNDAYEGGRYAALESGSFIFQDIALKNAESHCFLFSFALRARSDLVNGIARVIWLDRRGDEIGLGLSLIAQSNDIEGGTFKWLVYTGITEPAPRGTVAARVEFSHPDDTEGLAEMDVDNVLLCRLLN